MVTKVLESSVMLPISSLSRAQTSKRPLSWMAAGSLPNARPGRDGFSLPPGSLAWQATATVASAARAVQERGARAPMDDDRTRAERRSYLCCFSLTGITELVGQRLALRFPAGQRRLGGVVRARGTRPLLFHGRQLPPLRRHRPFCL